MAKSFDHSYSSLPLREENTDTLSTNRNNLHKRNRSLVNSPLSSDSDNEEQMASRTPLYHMEDTCQLASPLARLFPDCILCLWLGNVYSYVVVADLHVQACIYAGNHRPHTSAYWACIDEWYEYHKVAELAFNLTKENCVAHFTSNELCRLNWQRCQPTSLFNHNTVSVLVDTFPSTQSQVFVTDQSQQVEAKSTTGIYWCHNAFFSFLTVRLAKLLNIKLVNRRNERLIYSILKRHTDSFISEWTRT